MIASILAVFVLGLSLARFGVLAALLATAVSTCAMFIYEAMNGSTLTQALLSSIVLGAVLQVGYLVGAALLPLKK